MGAGSVGEPAAEGASPIDGVDCRFCLAPELFLQHRVHVPGAEVDAPLPVAEEPHYPFHPQDIHHLDFGAGTRAGDQWFPLARHVDDRARCPRQTTLRCPEANTIFEPPYAQRPGRVRADQNRRSAVVAARHRGDGVFVLPEKQRQRPDALLGGFLRRIVRSWRLLRRHPALRERMPVARPLPEPDGSVRAARRNARELPAESDRRHVLVRRVGPQRESQRAERPHPATDL
mmetsp:Transcript_70717/g.167718  ORF Transcript_70717/g.167718 Transcript_70717/m.167718 type:complete len:231 (-) Transcript_70717:95-787(-)